MNILLLGATGSIGRSVLSVIDQNNSELSLFGISFNENASEAENIIKEFSPSYVYIDNQNVFKCQKSTNKTQYLNGDSALRDLINHENVDVIICAHLDAGVGACRDARVSAGVGVYIDVDVVIDTRVMAHARKRR